MYGAGSQLAKATLCFVRSSRACWKKGCRRILLNLAGVGYIDSSGLGELVRTYTTLERQGGQLKMVNLNQRLKDLFRVTSLQKVFDIYEDEGHALQAFGSLASAAGG